MKNKTKEVKNEITTMSFNDIMSGLAEAIAKDQQVELMKKHMKEEQYVALNTQNIFLLTVEKERLLYCAEQKSAIVSFVEKAINNLIEIVNKNLTLDKLIADLDFVFKNKVSTETYNHTMNKIRRYVADMFFNNLISKQDYIKFHNEYLNTVFEKNKAK